MIFVQLATPPLSPLVMSPFHAHSFSVPHENFDPGSFLGRIGFFIGRRNAPSSTSSPLFLLSYMHNFSSALSFPPSFLFLLIHICIPWIFNRYECSRGFLLIGLLLFYFCRVRANTPLESVAVCSFSQPCRGLLTSFCLSCLFFFPAHVELVRP